MSNRSARQRILVIENKAAAGIGNFGDWPRETGLALGSEGGAPRLMSRPEPYEHARRLAADSLARGDPVGWFEHLYAQAGAGEAVVPWGGAPSRLDRKSTRLNSSHVRISYAVFCLKK